MQSRIDNLEILIRILDKARTLADGIGLKLLPFILDMARLEVLREVATEISNQRIDQHTQKPSLSHHQLVR